MTTSSPIDLSILIVAHNAEELMERCLEHVAASEDQLAKEIIFVDNGSTDGTVPLIEAKYPDVKIIKSPTNLGFIGANNLAYEQAKGKILLMLNSDAFIGKNTLGTLVNFLETHPECGVVGPHAVNGEGKPLPSARYFPTPWRLFLMRMGLAEKLPWKAVNDMSESHEVTRACDWVTGCCLFVRKEIVDEQGFFLRPELFMYNDDNDICLRAKKAGWTVYFHPETITHLQGGNIKKIADSSGIERLYLESDYIYFRHNYGLFAVFLHYLLLVLSNFLQLVKRCVLFQPVGECVRRIKSATKILWKTRFGNTPAPTD